MERPRVPLTTHELVLSRLTGVTGKPQLGANARMQTGWVGVVSVCVVDPKCPIASMPCNGDGEGGGRGEGGQRVEISAIGVLPTPSGDLSGRWTGLF